MRRGVGLRLGDKVALVVAVTPDLATKHKAGDIIKADRAIVGGSGGGRPDSHKPAAKILRSSTPPSRTSPRWSALDLTPNPLPLGKGTIVKIFCLVSLPSREGARG